MNKILSTMMTLVAITAPAFAAEWLTDLNTAKQKAAQEGKAILADFTGSDWCGYCIRLKKNVFDKPEFAQYAGDKFVLLEIDVPRNPKFSREQLEANEKLCEEYAVSGYPTIMVLTSQGDVAGGFVGGMPNLQAVQEALEPGIANAKALEAAYKLGGDEQLKALFSAYSAIPDELKPSAAKLRDRIAAADPANTTGVQNEIKAEAQLRDFESRLSGAQTPAQALEILNTLIPEALPANLPKLIDAKFSLQMLTVDSVEGIEEIKQTLLKMAELQPEMKDQIQAYIQQDFSDPAALLKKIQNMRSQRGM